MQERERVQVKVLVRGAAGVFGTLLDLWLVSILVGSTALIVVALGVLAGALPRSMLPPANAPERLAEDGGRAWEAIVAAVGSERPHCRIVLGFSTLEALIGRAVVGECREDERHDPVWSVAVQRTSGGLFAFRRADGTLAFTDGHRTWLLSAAGLQRRLNTERLCWEPDADPRACLRA